MHRFFAVVAFHPDWLPSLVSITTADLEQASREPTGQPDPGRVQRAYLERSGKISVVPFKRKPRVVDVAVESGVQTVRVELE